MKITPSRKVTRISLVSPLLTRSDLHERSRISLAQLNYSYGKNFFLCVFFKIYLFIHISTWKQTLHIICSQVAELIEAVKVNIHKEEKKKEAIESFSCWRDLTIGFRFLVIIIDSRSFMSSVLRRVLTVLENTQHPMFNTGKDIQL